jgi:hypothetical protein
VTRFSVAATVIFVVASTLAAGLLVSYGLAEHERLYQFIGAALFAPVVVGATRAAVNRVDESRHAAGAAAFSAVVLLFVVAIVVSSSWWDDSQSGALVLRIATTDPSAHVYLHQRPGGPELSGDHAPAPLSAAKGYQFDCEAGLADGSRWARLSNSSFWAPVIALRTQRGAPPAPLPRC